MCNLRSEISCGGNDASQVRELFSEAKLIHTETKNVGTTTNLMGGEGLPSFWS